MGKKGKSLFSEIIKSPKIKSAVSFAFSLVYGFLVLFPFFVSFYCFAIPNVLILFIHVLLVFSFRFRFLESYLKRASQPSRLSKYSQLAFFILLYTV